MDEIERSRVRQVALDAQVGHWQAHLGLNTDTERIEWLAKRLEGAIDDLNDRASCGFCRPCDDHDETE